MGNIFNDDFRDFLQQLNALKVQYILVGGYSVILHGHSRTTGDMDIWVNRTPENYKRLRNAFYAFGMPVFDMTEDNFLNHPDWEVFTYGKAPSSIDIMIKVKGLDFDETYKKAVEFIEDGLSIRTINLNDLKTAKNAANRAKDVDDIENLNKLNPPV